jgi:hypothetical protein
MLGKFVAGTVRSAHHENGPKGEFRARRVNLETAAE